MCLLSRLIVTSFDYAGTEVQKDDTNLLLTPSDADTILPVIPPPSTIVESGMAFSRPLLCL